MRIVRGYGLFGMCNLAVLVSYPSVNQTARSSSDNINTIILATVIPVSVTILVATIALIVTLFYVLRGKVFVKKNYAVKPMQNGKPKTTDSKIINA